MSSCDQWQSIQRAVDGEASPAARVLAAQHVRQCQACRTVLRSTLRIRRAIRSIPLLPLDPALSRRIQAALMLQRARLLQTWLRRTPAHAATILVGCTLLSLRGGAAN
ncbi:MAG: hypothetical protein RMJ35_05595, partial [Phycisphaerales bacterium]|nr:hypothetical protein [Phycisphaerales bacterium]